MSLSTYSGLKARIARVLNKTNLTDDIPDFIVGGEAVLKRRLRTRHQLQSAVLTLTGRSTGSPCGLTDIDAFTLADPVRELAYLTPQAFDALNFTTSCAPRYYTLVNDDLLVSPTPDRPYTATLRYRERFESLSASNPCNWLLSQHPDAYLYAALAESAPFLRDDDRLPMWERRLNQIIDEINAAEPRQPTRLRSDPAFLQHPRRAAEVIV